MNRSSLTLCLLAALPGLAAAARHDVLLKSRHFTPTPSVALLETTPAPAPGEVRHVLLQFAADGAAERDVLRSAGIELLQFVPEGTWIARVDSRAWNGTAARSALRWIGTFLPTDKLPARIAEGRVGAWARDVDGRVRLRVRSHPGIDGEELGVALTSLGAELIAPFAVGSGWLLRAPEAAILDFAALDAVAWISEDLPPPTTDNDGIRERVNANEVQSPPYDLTGFGVHVGMMDGGAIAAHPDFDGRVTTVDLIGATAHPTHVAGTLGGTGINSENQGGTPLQWRGVAPDVTFATWDFYGDVLQDYVDAIALHGIDLHHNSWGFTVSGQNCELYGDYDFIVPDLDSLVIGAAGRRVPIVYSAGNERDDGDCPLVEGGYGCLNPPKAAKNLLVVGGTNSDTDTMTEFSSWGPTDDGRLKPDVCAPGCEEGGEQHIHSTLPPDIYGGSGWCGTSMAAPVGSGAVALLHQAWDSTFVGVDPEPSFFRAILAATAVDLGNPGPDYAFGHGRIDIEAAAQALLGDTPVTASISQDDVVEYPFTVGAGTQSVRVVLAWDDPPAAPASDPALVNDLDLVLVSPTEVVYEPWILEPDFPSLDAVRGVDTRNNMEQVSVTTPEWGVWRARLTGTNVPFGPQVASLVGIDTQAPSGVSDVVLAGIAGNALSFTWQDDRVFDYTGTLIARSTGEISWTPTPGQALLQGQSPVPGVSVVYARSTDHSVVPWTDNGLAPDTDYYYAFFNYDDSRNYSPPTLAQARTDGSASLEEELASGVLRLSAPRPNPARGPAEIHFAVPGRGAVQLRVFDLAGRRVRTLIEGQLEGGEHRVIWDGTDDGGHPVSTGHYFLELRAGADRRTERIGWTR